MTRSLTLSSPAKVNLRLEVLGRRADGYHELQMVNLPLELADTVELTPIDVGMELTCDDPAVPSDESNLAFRAALALRDLPSRPGMAPRRRGVRIRLTKRIPAAAGLGGGSSNAATVLRGLNDLWGLGLGDEDLAAIGVKLGADVPYFLHNRPTVVRGIGEILEPIAVTARASAVLLNPGFGVSTKEVYGALGLLPGARGARSDLPERIDEFDALIRLMRNDLEMPVRRRHSEISQMKGYLLEKGAAGAMMSGSGPTVFGLFDAPDPPDVSAWDLPDERWRVIATRVTNEA
ncbi:MAG: 4-(cytidine 5'-diphospho)-2-C-methyl-D-erythritol kinase [Deltaproteobacteria bacterium]|nr:4-(cytidine 5'-diphospho)-2-C-methyl-D-erythritol kinase [Deltaproteobacteria bacterium]